jgi:hypothetical protein
LEPRSVQPSHNTDHAVYCYKCHMFDFNFTPTRLHGIYQKSDRWLAYFLFAVCLVPRDKCLYYAVYKVGS